MSKNIKGFECPFCMKTMAVDANNTYRRFFMSSNGYSTSNSSNIDMSEVGAMDFSYYFCPACNKTTIIISINTGNGWKVIPLQPSSRAKQYPDYIPEQIRKDYIEAYEIVSLSPRASATLSRRCLQGIIRDIWKDIPPGRLVDEIQALENKIETPVWEAIDSVRQIGNIGAHMEKNVDLIIDIDPDEAEILLELIEFLFQAWYIDKQNQKSMLTRIKEIGKEKQEARKQK